jgi:hypothetical protein
MSGDSVFLIATWGGRSTSPGSVPFLFRPGPNRVCRRELLVGPVLSWRQMDAMELCTLCSDMPLQDGTETDFMNFTYSALLADLEAVLQYCVDARRDHHYLATCL